jgi:hypothetical protein
MKRAKSSCQHGSIPKDAVLLIPEPDGKDELPTCGVKPGYYTAKQMLGLVEKHLNDADAIQFIADMLESGDSDNDGFVQLLRSNRQNPDELARIVKICKE